MPPSHFFSRFYRNHRMIWYFKYGDDFKGPSVLEGDNVGATNPMSAHLSTFLHPKFEVFAPSEKSLPASWNFTQRGSPMLEHWGLENLNFDFSLYSQHVQMLEGFLESVITTVSEDL